MTGMFASVTEEGHCAEQLPSSEDSEAIECPEDEALTTLPATYENPDANDQDPEHQEAPGGDLNTVSEGQELSFTTSPPSENVLNNTPRYLNKDMKMNEKVSHGKNSHLTVYNTAKKQFIT